MATGGTGDILTGLIAGMLAQYPERAEAAILEAKGDLDGAIAEWREAARLDPKYPPPHANLGEALESKGDVQGAIAAYEHFLELAPSAPNAAAVRKRLTALKAAGKH